MLISLHNFKLLEFFFPNYYMGFRLNYDAA